MFQKQYNRISPFYKLIVRNRGVVDVVNVYDSSYYSIWLCEDASWRCGTCTKHIAAFDLKGEHYIFESNLHRNEKIGIKLNQIEYV